MSQHASGEGGDAGYLPVEAQSDLQPLRPVSEVSPAELRKLQARIGRVHLQQRLGVESDHATQVFGRGRNFFHIENWYSVHGLIRMLLRCSGLYRRGVRNARNIRVRHNDVVIQGLLPAFEGFTLLQLSDLHLDMDPAYPQALIHCLRGLEYDICVLTGDYRARTFGRYDRTLESMARLRPHLGPAVYAILGNHDSIRMVPALEEMDITLLLNESVALRRGEAALYLAGIDDPHYFRTENFEKAAQDIPDGAPAVLLSHSPESYRRAAHVGFQLMLSGHTHGGQICLPGGLALLTNADCPRQFCRGAWRYHGMQGYTSAGSGSSVVEVRYNCPPEVTLHRLRAGA